MITDDGNFVYLKKHYDLYRNIERLQQENVVIRHMIFSNKKFIDIQGKIPKDLYDILVKKKMRVEEEEKAIRGRVIRKLHEIVNEEHFQKIMKIIEPLLRNMTRVILIMGGNYGEVNKETYDVIIKVMTKFKDTKVKKYSKEKIMSSTEPRKEESIVLRGEIPTPPTIAKEDTKMKEEEDSRKIEAPTP